jgi:hypothetical protein
MSKFRQKPASHLFHVVAPPDLAGFELTQSDLDDQLRGRKLSSLFLGEFEIPQIEPALERFGIVGRLHELGYGRVEVEFHARGPFEHFLRIVEAGGDEPVLLAEIVLKLGRYAPPRQPLPAHPLPPLDVISIEWMLMQHVRGEFTDRHRRLPGQEHPGLGLGHKVMDLLLWVATFLEKDAMLNMPAYFHNAVFYDRWFKFSDPLKQGEMNAIVRDLSAEGCDLSAMSYAAYFGCLVEKNSGAHYHWEPREQILPLAEKAKHYFALPDWAHLAEQRAAELSFTMDRGAFDEKMKTAGDIEW